MIKVILAFAALAGCAAAISQPEPKQTMQCKGTTCSLVFVEQGETRRVTQHCPDVTIQVETVGARGTITGENLAPNEDKATIQERALLGSLCQHAMIAMPKLTREHRPWYPLVLAAEAEQAKQEKAQS